MGDDLMITSCPHCHWKFRVRSSSAGENGQCTKCGNTFRLDEYLEQPEVYKPAKVEPAGESDDIIAPPIRTPSYPSLRAGATAQQRQGGAGETSYGRTRIPDGQSAPAYWALRAVALGNIIAGGIAITIGVLLLIYELLADHSIATAAPKTIGVYYGVAVIFGGMVSAAMGQALVVLRDIAINSFLALERRPRI